MGDVVRLYAADAAPRPETLRSLARMRLDTMEKAEGARRLQAARDLVGTALSLLAAEAGWDAAEIAARDHIKVCRPKLYPGSL